MLGVYLITDSRDGWLYVGKADGVESIRQRWSAYAANGHGGNVELRGLDPAGFRFSLVRVFDPATPTRVIDETESHFKNGLDSRKHGLNRNEARSHVLTPDVRSAVALFEGLRDATEIDPKSRLGSRGVPNGVGYRAARETLDTHRPS